jgi:hypothetical protein
MINMNFIGESEDRGKVELKYCERCGGLWLRPEAADGVYCASCKVSLASRPDPGRSFVRTTRRRKARLPGTHAEGRSIQGRIGSLQGVALSEVRA